MPHVRALIGGKVIVRKMLLLRSGRHQYSLSLWDQIHLNTSSRLGLPKMSVIIRYVVFIGYPNGSC